MKMSDAVSAAVDNAFWRWWTDDRVHSVRHAFRAGYAAGISIFEVPQCDLTFSEGYRCERPLGHCEPHSMVQSRG